MNGKNQILGSQDKKNLRDELLKKAGEDDLVKRALRGEFRKTELLEDLTMLKPGDMIGLEEIEFDTGNIPRIHKTLAFHPDGNHVLMTSSYEKAVSVYNFDRKDPSRGLSLYAGMRFPELSIATFSPDGEYVATLTGNRLILGLHRFYKNEMSPARAFRSIASIEVPYQADSLTIHPDNKHIVIGFNELFVNYEFNGKDIEEINRQPWHNRILDIALDPKERYIAIANKDEEDYSATTHRIYSVMRFEANPSHLIISVPPLFSVDFSSDGEYLALGCKNAIDIIRLKGDNPILVTDKEITGDIYSVSFDPKGDYILALDGSNDARLFKILRKGRK